MSGKWIGPSNENKRPKMKTYIVIPAYNEASSIGKVLASLIKGGYKSIVVVDDGSSDGTYRAASNHKVDVLRHPINRGQGAALKTGIDFALLKGAGLIVTFDADGQHQVKDIKSMIEPITQGKADITIGSRYLKKSQGIPLLKKLYQKIGAVIIFLMYGVKMTDSHNGLRALSRKAAGEIEIKCDKMDHASEIIDQIKKKRLRYKEVPVDILYTEYSMKHGQNYLNAFNIFLRMVFKKLVG
jgi:glycosyltransferase involved in cell wall biosynthesis